VNTKQKTFKSCYPFTGLLASEDLATYSEVHSESGQRQGWNTSRGSLTVRCFCVWRQCTVGRSLWVNVSVERS